ncbi:Cof-type HAD-IIB family hydrolase [Lentibacillus cibarius]|uniref:Cof-type HAD-IIB family hydrolase n=1 Tax=Lentibacillus cibarius TaxID=2583219 RepID=A0A549YF42_9BACI|nr:Cof-type HAD-IIB family hydrolase [Lentibacillus cibarius]TMN21600.1 Cof-type HAD-IIB family hydrolase [Lentibacillus cibarius]TRM10499.1 Cof-type HAD-IIB family hydrolase [Lentibacillus cibarius]
MTKKLICLDIDGTLFNEEKQVPDSAKLAVANLQQAGHTVAFATGRAPFTFRKLQQELEVDSYVSLNGQYVVHHDDVVYKNPLHTAVLDELEHHATAGNHPLIYLGHDNWFSNTSHHPYIQKAIRSLKVEQKVMYDPAFYRVGDVYQALLFCEDGSEADYMRTFGHLEFIRWHDYSVDVIPAGGSKAAGINHLVQHLQMSPDDVYAFGDGLNDMAMLQSVKNSVAMGNAPDIVKNAAGTVTKHVNDDGLWHGLRMVGLLD